MNHNNTESLAGKLNTSRKFLVATILASLTNIDSYLGQNCVASEFTDFLVVFFFYELCYFQ